MATKNAAKAEATSERISFEWNGEEFTVIPTSEWPFEALEAYEDGKVTQFLRAILGPEEYAHFKSLRPRTADLESFVDTIQAALGIEGN